MMINFSQIIMLFSWHFLAVASCAGQKQVGKLKAVEVRDSRPSTGETFYRIFHFDSIFVFQSQYEEESFVSQYTFDSTTNRIESNPQLLSKQWNDSYFLFHKDSSYGYRFDANKEEKRTRVSVVSEVDFIRGTNRFDSFLSIQPDTVTWNRNKTELVEVYGFAEKEEWPKGRLILYFSSRLNHLPATLNPIVDSTMKMKLFKAETFFEEYYSKTDKLTWPAMKISTEMKQIEVGNTDTVMRYLNLYKEILAQQKQDLYR